MSLQFLTKNCSFFTLSTVNNQTMTVLSLCRKLQQFVLESLCDLQQLYVNMTTLLLRSDVLVIVCCFSFFQTLEICSRLCPYHAWIRIASLKCCFFVFEKHILAHQPVYYCIPLLANSKKTRRSNFKKYSIAIEGFFESSCF